MTDVFKLLFLNLKIFVSRRTWSLDREGIHATEVLVVSILHKQLHDRLVWYIAKMLQYQNRPSNVTWLCIISVCAFRLRPFDVINVRWRAFVVEVARRKDSLRSISFSIYDVSIPHHYCAGIRQSLPMWMVQDIACASHGCTVLPCRQAALRHITIVFGLTSSITYIKFLQI